MLVVALLALTVASVDASAGLPFCITCGDECRPPRRGLNFELLTEEDPEHPGTTRECACNCGKRETEQCLTYECAFGLRCLHSQQSGNICKPLCSDPGEYMKTSYTSCEADLTNDEPIILPRYIHCGYFEAPVNATRQLSSGVQVEMSFVNTCHMSNANAQLVEEGDAGTRWKIAILF